MTSIWKWIKHKFETVLFSRFWIRFTVTTVVAALFLAGFSILVQQLEQWRYVKEIDTYEKVITKYTLTKDSPWNDLSREPVRSAESIGYENIDAYYDLVAKEYAIEDFSYWDTKDQQSSNLSNGSASANRQEAGTAPASIQNPLTFEPELIQLSGELRDLRTLRRFSGLTGDEEGAQFAEEDEIALSLDAEGQDSDLDLDISFDEDYVQSRHRHSSLFTNERRNQFYTSPIPDNEEISTRNTLDQLRLVLDKDEYYSYELVRVNLIARTPLNLNDFRVFVRRGKYLIPNVGGKHDGFFKYRDRTIYTSMALGYSPSPGVYHVLVRSKSDPDWPGIEKSFVLKRRPVNPLPPGFGIVNLEYTNPLKNRKIIRPNGTMGDYHAIMEWTRYMDSDALWMLVAQTVGWDRNITPEQPWKSSGIGNLDLLGPAAEEANVLLGGYMMSYFTPGDGKKRAGYQTSLGYTGKTDELLNSRHISLLDPKRYRDLLAMAVSLEKNPYVDYIGFDFIRTGRADGYEMAPRFVDEMNIVVPADFDEYPRVEQSKWLARRLENQANTELILKWRWWRAHTVASIVHSVMVDGRITKPTWVFTLGWRHGQEHGQDPNMFFDAGVTADAVMLYEANRNQFANLMRQWNNYMRNNRNNIVIGNAVDTRFLDSLHGVPAIEYVYRTKQGYRKIYREGFAKGIFSHDLSRALWSSKRGYDVSEWAIIHGHSLSAYRWETGLIPYEGSIQFETTSSGIDTGTITITNSRAEPLDNLTLTFSPTPAWEHIKDNIPPIISLEPNEEMTFTFEATRASGYRSSSSNPILGYVLDHPTYSKYFFFTMPKTTERLQQYLTYRP